ncbi:MAG TPA: hypothetical protein VFT84_03730 [Gemmatimonadales bacterium]|nr:hypothetical protein [Gemmatimonadales bacterium]
MRPRILLALGVATAAAAAALSPALAPGQATAGDDSRFSAEVRGAVTRHYSGHVVLGPVGRPGEAEAAYTITLGAEGGTGAIVLTRLGSEPLRPGRYPLGESAALDSAGGFRVLYLAGSATRPEGVFRAESGTVEIESADAGGIRGALELTATGFVATDPDDESREVRITARLGGVRLP